MILREYQLEDLNYLKGKARCALFNEPRTGKTPTAISWLRIRKCTTCLVVCPASAIPGWEYELSEWYDGIHIYACTSPKKQKKDNTVAEFVSDIAPKVLIISYDTLKTTRNREGYVDILKKAKIEGIAVDEAHRLRGRDTATAIAVFRLSRVIPNVIALTGTPAFGKPEDLFAILQLLFPQKYTSYWRWVDEWCTVYNGYNEKADKEYKDVRGIKKSKRDELVRILTTFSTIRKRSDVMPWLPCTTKLQVCLPLSTKQKYYLTELENWFRVDDIVVEGVLDRLIRYRQICDSPELLGLDTKSPKLDWIKQYLKDYPEESVIIFSNFTEYLKILNRELEGSAMIVGATPVKKRGELCRQFQNGDIKVLLINIQAGREALTLDRADTTIFTDKYPPIGSIEQAEARFLATTEEQAHRGHKIVELMMDNSYDKEIYKMLNSRAREVDIINNYNKYLERK